MVGGLITFEYIITHCWLSCMGGTFWFVSQRWLSNNRNKGDYQMMLEMATSKTWTQTLDPDSDPGPWTLDPGPGPWTQTLKNLDPEKPGLWKTWINIGLKKMSDFRELCFTKTIHNVSYCLKVRVLTDTETKFFRLNYSAVTWKSWNLCFCSSNIACRHIFN